MAWINTETDRLRQQLRNTIGPAVWISQCLSLAPYPLSLFQKKCSTDGVRFRVITFFRYMFGILTTALTIASQFVLFIYYPYLLYQPKVPIFIVILYYIVNILQSMTIAIMMIGCEARRGNYEGYFINVLSLINDTEPQRDCQTTIWYRNTVRALLFFYATVTLVLPIIMASVLQEVATIPYVITHIIPFVVSYLILMQYYCVLIHVSSILRKLNERLVPLMNMKSHLESGFLRQKHHVYNILGQSLSSSRVENNHLEQIEKLRLMHVRALDIAGSLSGKFGTVIILIVVAAFASVNIELLELYQCVKLGNLGPLYIVMKFLFAVIKFSFYILIAYPNRLIQNENQRTLFMLYKIKRTSCTLETNGAIEHYISQITNLQDIHQACGMINLDMKLISNVVAAITSIMVVLIQFSDTGL
uniref:Gustatory receptor n=1 Tax=Anopheles minimus TaxID=112268 RepID=A0A182WBC1_9DIPT